MRNGLFINDMQTDVMKNTVIKKSHMVLIAGIALVVVVIYGLIHLLSFSVQDKSYNDIKNHLNIASYYQNDTAHLQSVHGLMSLSSQNKACIVKTVYQLNKPSGCPSTSANKTIFIKKSTFI
jgi:hypothetical protein